MDLGEVLEKLETFWESLSDRISEKISQSMGNFQRLY